MTYEEKQCKWLNETKGDLHEKDLYYCEKCRNKGFIYKVINGEVKATKCECLKVRKSIKALQDSGLQEFIESKTFESFKVTENWQKRNKELAQMFINQDQVKWFFIGGQVGAGKSHLCTAMCGELLKQGKPTRYMLWSEVSKKLKANINEDTYFEILEPYQQVDVLYIDDFFKVRKGQLPTSADVNIAFDLLNSRLFSKDKITIISSEFTLNELLPVDEGVISRIVEKAGCFAVNIASDTSKNYRLK